MIEFFKKNLIIIGLFIITLFVGFFTFLTFIDKSFIELNQSNLQYLLIINIILIILLFVFVYLEIRNSIKTDIDHDGINSNKKYITYFSSNLELFFQANLMKNLVLPHHELIHFLV